MTITDHDWERLLETRARRPHAVAEAYAARQRRAVQLARGDLFLVAADHPARGSLKVGQDPLAMANRRELLSRLMTALENPRVDGVLGAPDVVEELLLLGALDGKVVIGSMNRGGLDGAAWTMDDRFTAYDAEKIGVSNLDGGKMLIRIDDDDPATARTLEACANAVGQLAARGLMAMIEPLPYARDTDGSLRLRTESASLARAIAIAAALGTTSAHTWLKLPSCTDPEQVFAATTLPCLVLGGAVGPDLEEGLRAWQRALQQPNVRGLVIGRALLYPADGDVTAAVAAAAKLLEPAS